MEGDKQRRDGVWIAGSLALSCATSPMIMKRRSPRHHLVTAALLFFPGLAGVFSRPQAARGLCASA